MGYRSNVARDAPWRLSEFGDAVYEERTRRGLSQKGLQELAGVHFAVIQRVEAKRGLPNVIAFGKLCRALGLKPSYFLGTGEEAECQ